MMTQRLGNEVFSLQMSVLSSYLVVSLLFLSIVLRSSTVHAIDIFEEGERDCVECGSSPSTSNPPAPQEQAPSTPQEVSIPSWRGGLRW